MRVSFLHIAAIVLALIFSGGVCGQTQVQVITKTVQETFTLIPGYDIKVVGESAKIEVVGWDHNEVKVEMKLISKGLTRALAERELEYQKYAISDVDKMHVIKNFLLVPSELKELSSIQETEIKVWVPNRSDLMIENRFGTIRLAEYDGEVEIKSEYGNISLIATSGKTEINGHFGDLLIRTYVGSLDLKLTHTETKISGFRGNGSITSNLGDLDIEVLGVDEDLKVNGLKSDVKFAIKSIDDYYWIIRSKYGQLVGPEELINKVQSIKNIKVEYGESSKGEIAISTDFGEILIEEL